MESESHDHDAILSDENIGSRGPLVFLRKALPGGLSASGWELLLAWVCFQAVVSWAWAQHLRGLAGPSSLPAYWGEQLTARDIWEMVVNGGLGQHPLGAMTTVGAALFLGWALWAGWKVQAKSASLRPGLRAWVFGLFDACLLGILPNLLVVKGIHWFLALLGRTGIQGLGWLELVMGPLVALTGLSAFLLQWWLCRINRAGALEQGWRMGSWSALGRHLAHSFLRVWLHPVQWTLLMSGGVILRLGLHALVFLLAWRWGGGTSVRVWAFLVLQLAAAAGAAWSMGWMLRTVAGFWRHDAHLREEIRRLQRRAAGLPVE